MELRSFLAVATILVSVVLIMLTLMQAKGTGIWGAPGGGSQDTTFRTRRGMQRTLHRLTIVVAIVFVSIAAWSVAAS
ncbi:MAG: preprotein translocase subunit SecG [Chloroflexi bacterium]|nr:MAG: preprotein translocase subunit SecG [Chloroflexota bacterium]